jgi:hypothetical protein
MLKLHILKLILSSIETLIKLSKSVLYLIHHILDKSEPIPGNFDKRSSFSAFLGVLPILNKSFLVFVETCEKACTIESQDIF